MAIEPNKQTVAFIGLGRMGLPIAANILKAGFPLVVWNRTPQKADSLVKSGALLAADPAQAAAQADVVITSLMDDESVLSITTGRQGLLKGMRPSAIHIGASTVSPKLSDRLFRLHQKHGSHYVAGPVLGRPDAAEAAQLMTFLGGDEALIERVRAVVTTYAPSIIVAGDRPALANVAKLVANFLAVSALDLIGQSLALAEKSKLDQRIVVQLLLSYFGFPAMKQYVGKIADRDFDSVGFVLSGGLKDVELMITAAHDVGLTLTGAEAIRKKMRAALKSGLRDKDWCSFTEVDRR